MEIATIVRDLNGSWDLRLEGLRVDFNTGKKRILALESFRVSSTHGLPWVLYICTVHLLGSAVPLAQLNDFETTCENSRRLRSLEVKFGDTISFNYSP
jgi:hypothetical protein